MISEIFYLLNFFFTFYFFLKYYIKKKEFNYFSPYFLYPIIYFIYSYAGLLFYNENESDIFGNFLGKNIGTHYFITCSIGLYGILLGFLFTLKGQISYKVVPSIKPKSFNRLILIYFCLSILLNYESVVSQFNIFDVKSYAEMAFASRIELRENKSFAIWEILFQTTPTVLFIYACLEKFRSSKNIIKYVLLIPLLLLIVHSFLAGTRAVFVSYILFIFFYLYFNTTLFNTMSKKRGIILFSIFLSTYVLINIIPIIRSASNFYQMIDLFNNFYHQYGLSFLKLQNSSELQTSINLQKLQHEIINNNASFMYGKNIINDLFVFLPRIFFENRPLPTSELFVLKFYPDIYSQGGGMGMFILIDGYWSFGNIGVLLTCFLFAIFISVMYNSIIRAIKINRSAFYLFVIYFQTFIISSVRGGMILSIRSFFLSTFIFYIIAFISKNLFFKSHE